MNEPSDFHLDRIHRWLEKKLGYCAPCDRFFVYPKVRRRNTAYDDDSLNYNCLCKDCYEEEEEYWAERWADYNAGRY